MRLLLTAMVFGVLAFAASGAQACGGNDPAGVEGEIIFNETINAPQFCDGDEWIPMKGGEPRKFNPMLANCSAAGTLNLAVAGVKTGASGEDFLGLWADGNFVFAANGWGGAGGNSLKAYAFDGSSFTEVASSAQMLNFPEGIWKQGNYIYVGSPGDSGTATAGLHVFGWDGSALTHLDSNTTDVHEARQMTGDGQYIYVASGDNGVHAFTFNGTTLTKVGDSIPDTVSNFSHGAYARDGYIYIAQGAGGLQVATFNGTNWNVIDTDTTAGNPGRVWHDGRYVYATVDEGLAAYSFNGTSLTHIANYPLTTNGRNVWGDGNHIYVSENGGDDTFSALTFDGSSFTLIDSIVLDGGNGPRGITGNGTYLFVGEENGDLHALSGFNCTNPQVASNFTHIVPNGLLAHWRLDENSGTTAYDTSGNGYDGTMSGGVDATNDSVTGAVRNAISFDGPSTINNIAIAYDTWQALSADFSLAAWVKFDPAKATSGSGYRVISSQMSPTAHYFLRVENVSDSRVPQFGVRGATGALTMTGTTDINDGNWHYIVATRTGNAHRLYLDGVQEDTTRVANTGAIDTGQDLHIGAYNTTSENFPGFIDDVRLYNRAIDEEEITKLYKTTGDGIRYNANSRTMEYFDGNRYVSMTPEWGAPAAGLVGHWKLDEMSGTTVIDSSGNDYDGIMQNLSADDNNTSGAVNSSITLNGIDDYISIPHAAELNPTDSITLSAWIKSEGSTGDNQRIIGKWGPGGNSFNLFMAEFDYGSDGLGLQPAIEVAIGSTNFVIDADDNGAIIGDGIWHHVAGTYDGTSLNIYVNGALQNTLAATGAIDPSTGPINIGRDENNYGHFFGSIDDARIYNRPLSATEIQQLYQIGSPVGQNLAAPEDCPNIGDVCDDGTVYAGISPDGSVAMYAAPTDEIQDLRWNNGNSTGRTTTNQTSFVTGESNTANLSIIDADSGTADFQPHSAAAVCANKVFGGTSDWYLPARDEFQILYNNRAAIGGFVDSGWFVSYWTSTENDQASALLKDFSSGNTGFMNKENGISTRCVRKGPAPRCSNPYGIEGEMVYNNTSGGDTTDVVQYCDGARWIAIGKTAP